MKEKKPNVSLQDQNKEQPVIKNLSEKPPVTNYTINTLPRNAVVQGKPTIGKI